MIRWLFSERYSMFELLPISMMAQLIYKWPDATIEWVTALSIIFLMFAFSMYVQETMNDR